MKHIFIKVASIVALATSLVALSFAGHKHTQTVPKCSVCHMALSTHKTKMMSRPVKIGKKTYYCCAGCNMGKMSMKKGMMSHSMAMKCPTCHMALSLHKTKMMSRAVKVGKKTYYCCAHCKMPMHHGMLVMQKPMKCPVCHMMMTHREKGYTVPVRMKKGGPIYWCCTKCHMPAKYLVHFKHVVKHSTKHTSKH